MHGPGALLFRAPGLFASPSFRRTPESGGSFHPERDSGVRRNDGGEDAMPELFTVHAASLDDPSRYKPAVVTYTVRGHAWDHIDPALPRFDKMPTA
jgi:hypothetical protein